MSDYTDTEKSIEKPVETSKNEKFFIFSILGNLYCFPSDQIGEITLFDTVYPLPLMPSYILGMVNRYSVPYALFDLSLLFQKAESPHKKIVIIKEEIDRVAFLIDDVSGITDIQSEDIITIEKSSDSGELADVITASFKWKNENVFILNINRIISRVSQEIA
jgi:purine-binding chemotaxis protein CheW